MSDANLTRRPGRPLIAEEERTGLGRAERQPRIVRPERVAGLPGAREVAVVAKTNIQCGGARHRVRVRRDGSVEAEDCLDAVEDAQQLEERALRGEDIGEQRGCAALVALTTLAMPRLVVTGGVRDVRDFGVWLPTYVVYEENKVTRFVAKVCATIRDAKHAPHIAVARDAFFSIFKKGRFWKGRALDDLGPEDVVTFEPDAHIFPGLLVGLDRWSDWTVPLQAGWLERVGVQRACMDGKFVVGWSDTAPDVVLAIDPRADAAEGFRVQEHRVVGNRLVALPLPEPKFVTSEALAAATSSSSR